jgi:hypothetical protein
MAFACQSKQEGRIEGIVAPPCSDVQVTARQPGKAVAATAANSQDGKFTMTLSPGTYAVSVTSPSSPFPVTLVSIVVDPGRTTTLPPVQVAQVVGAAVLTGTISPAGAGTKVTLFYEGRERAAAEVTPDGKYEFSSLPGGNYTLLATAPGYAGDTVEVRIAGDQKAAQNIRLLYITAVEGVDWNRGTIRAKGRGMYPPNATNRTVMHELAKRAALSEAERNLLRAVEQIKVDQAHDVRSFTSRPSYTVRIQGFIQGYKIIGERELEGGIEVELEVPLSGANGLTRILSD